MTSQFDFFPPFFPSFFLKFCFSFIFIGGGCQGMDLGMLLLREDFGMQVLV